MIPREETFKSLEIGDETDEGVRIHAHLYTKLKYNRNEI